MIKFLIKILLILFVGTLFTLLPNHKNSLVYAASFTGNCADNPDPAKRDPDPGYEGCYESWSNNTYNKIQLGNSETRFELRDCWPNNPTQRERCVVGSYKYYYKCSRLPKGILGNEGCPKVSSRETDPRIPLSCKQTKPNTDPPQCIFPSSPDCGGVPEAGHPFTGTALDSNEGIVVVNAPTNILPPIQFSCATYERQSDNSFWWNSSYMGYFGSEFRQAPNFGQCKNGNKCTKDRGITWYDRSDDGRCSGGGATWYDANPDSTCSPGTGTYSAFNGALSSPIYVVKCVNDNDCSNIANGKCDKSSGDWRTWACKPDPNNPPIRAFVTSSSYTGDLKQQGQAADGVTGADNLCQSAAASSTFPNLGSSTWRAWVSSDTTGTQQDMVQNGSFNNGQLNPWECVTATGSCNIDNTLNPGNPSAKVSRTSSDSYISQDISALGVSGGDTLRLSVKIYGAGAAAYSNIYCNSQAPMVFYESTTAGSWKTIEKMISIPNNCTSPIFLNLYAHANNSTIWFDDISLTKSAGTRIAKDRIQDGTYSDLNLRKIIESKQSLLFGFPQQPNPINLAETGNLVNGSVWTGTDLYGLLTPYTCSKWNSSQSNDAGTYGLSSANTGSYGYWTNSGAQGCNNPSHLYCFEQLPPRISIQSVNAVTTPPWNVTIASPEIIFNTNVAANCRYSTVDESYDQMGPSKNLSVGQGSTVHRFTPPALSLGNNNLHLACEDLTSQQASNSSGNNYDLAINYNPTPCSGTIALSFTRTEASVTPAVGGLSNCNGKTVTFKTGNSCTPPNGVDFTPVNACSVVGSGCPGRAFNAPATNTEYSACIDQNGDSDYTDPGERATATLQITSTTQSGSCTSGTNRADGLVSAPEITGKFNTSGGCAIDPKSAFVPFKIPTFDSLKSIYFDQSKLPRTGDNQQLYTISGPPIELGGNRDRVYFINGDLTIDDPDDIRGNQTGLIFVSGKLNITGSKLEHGNDTSGLVFVVRGNVTIDKDVREINSVIISEGVIYTAGENCPVNTVLATNPLIVNGSLISINQSSSSNPPIRFCRNLSNNNASPAEIINHQIKYLPILKDLFSNTYQKWSEIP